MIQEIDSQVLKQHHWENFEFAVRNVNTDVHHLFSHRLINECCSFYQLVYNYGELIIKDGCLQLPEQNFGNMNSTDFAKVLNNPNDYFLIVLNKPLEQFISLPSRILSLNIFEPGSLIHLPKCQKVLAGDFSLPWQLSAGLRTLFLLPKITDNMGYNRLRLAYQLTAMKPLRNLYDQWHIFRQIAQHPDIQQQWQAKILLVLKKQQLSNDANAHWQHIQHYVQQQQEQLRSRYSRPLSADIVWQIFLESADPQRFKLKSHLVDTIKHLYAISAELTPGFVPASYNDEVAPITCLSQAFTQIYKLRNYLPTFMHLANIERCQPQMVYYSMAFPQLINHQANHAVASISQRELYELMQLIELVQKVVHNSSFEHYQLDYFHIDSDKSLNIYHSSKVVEDDPRFMTEQDREAQREFCASSIFWRGCIRLKC